MFINGRAGSVHIRKRDFEGVRSNAYFRLLCTVGIEREYSAYSGAVGFDEVQSVEHLRQIPVAELGYSVLYVVGGKSLNKPSQGDELHAAVIHVDYDTSAE